VPAFFVPTALSGIAITVLDGTAPGYWFRCAGVLGALWLVLLIVLYRLTLYRMTQCYARRSALTTLEPQPSTDTMHGKSLDKVHVVEKKLKPSEHLLLKCKEDWILHLARRKAIGVIPGGTSNQWASETSVPVDPVKAALALIESNVHTVDLGRLQVQEILFPNHTQESQQQQQNRQKTQKSKAKQPSSQVNYFLLTAGLGFDASVISHTSKGLKQRVGSLAYDLAAAESLPEQHAFPIEVMIVEDGQDQPMVWSGDAYQVILGNTRRYANAIELTPDVYLDDGKLELCLITAGNSISSLQQISSLSFKHKPDTLSAKHFLATHYLITLPASVHIHLDGSAVQLEDYLNKSDRDALRQEQHREQVMVKYRFDAIPHALRTAIPRIYDNTLFEHAGQQEENYTEMLQPTQKDTVEKDNKLHEKVQSESTDLINKLRCMVC
jgi:diacylglycerol kinase family enzyme